MRKLFSAQLLAAFLSVTASLSALTIGTANVRYCIEESKIGKSEQSQFEELKKQLEQGLEQKDKELNELAPKLKDEYLDTLTPEAERELKEKFNQLSQEMSIQQNQYYQTLNSANYQFMSKILEMIQEASKIVATQKKLDLILNDEACFYKNDSVDVSKEIVKELDAAFDKAQKK